MFETLKTNRLFGLLKPKIEIRRTIYTSKCPSCGDVDIETDKAPRERQCPRCKTWVPYVADSYTGKDFR